MPGWIEKWDGGRVYRDRDGKRRYVIEKMRNGRRYSVPLRPGADEKYELALFLKDPDGYERRNEVTGLLPDEAVVLTLDEVKRFKRYQLEEKHRVPVYAQSVAGYLTDWANALGGRDLRKVRVDDLYRILDGWDTARNYRMAAIKSYSTYLVKRQRLKIDENAAAHLESVKAPPSRLLKLQGYSIKQVEEFYSALDSPRVRAYFCLGAKCGMHGTEIQRVANNEVRIEMVNQRGIAAVLRFIHKGRHDHRQSIDAQCLAAVRLLMKHGAPTTTMCKDWVDSTAAKLGKPPVHHKYLRHSFFTWMRQVGSAVRLQAGGLSLQEVAALVGHRSLLMGKDHYDNSEVPPMPVLPIRLYHPEDPIALDIGAGERAETRG